MPRAVDARASDAQFSQLLYRLFRVSYRAYYVRKSEPSGDGPWVSDVGPYGGLTVTVTVYYVRK